MASLLETFEKDCAQCGDRCFHLLAAERKVERTQWLAEAGVDVMGRACAVDAQDGRRIGVAGGHGRFLTLANLKALARA